jgi:teichuronic acid biosynthesis glycosyltransferase TuaG
MTNVSIVTPTYNSIKFIERTVQSVLNQTFKDWEWIIVDDLSTDGTREYLTELQNRDPRIKCVLKEVNEGSGPTRNKAIELASYKYIAFLDSDDIWIPEKLALHVNFMEKNKSAFSHTSYGFIDENDKIIKQTFHVSDVPVYYEDLLKRTEISCLTAMYNQDVLGKMYMPDLRRKQDYALWLSILKKGFHSDPLDIETAFYRQHNSSATSNKIKLILKHIEFLRKNEELNIFKSLYYTFHWGFGGLRKYYLVKK